MKYAGWKDDPKGKRKGRSTPKAHKQHLARLKATKAKLEQSRKSDRSPDIQQSNTRKRRSPPTAIASSL